MEREREGRREVGRERERKGEIRKGRGEWGEREWEVEMKMKMKNLLTLRSIRRCCNLQEDINICEITIL